MPTSTAKPRTRSKSARNPRSGSRPPLLVLASASPRRRILLRQLGIPFRVLPSHIDEKSRFRDPKRFVEDLALQKARAVAKTLRIGRVLGADTIVVCRGKILGKPLNARHAYQMLYALGGSRHKVYTGVAVVDARTGRARSAVGVSIVQMKKIDLDTILRLSKKHLDKAGAYAIQQKDPIAKVVEGSYDNVVGLPMGLVKKLLGH